MNPSPYGEDRMINFCLVFSVTSTAEIQECFVNELFSYYNGSPSETDFIFIRGEQEFELLEAC